MESFVRNAARLAIVVAALTSSARAQESRSVNGAVQRIERDTTVPVANAWVVLHRVARAASGPLDSMRTDANGRYGFRYTKTATDSAVYFVSSQYAGVTYFTSPLTVARVTGDDAEIVVYDTTSVGARVATRSRHIVMFTPHDGAVAVSEVYWIENGDVRTRVASTDSPSWESLLPSGATDVRVDGGDVAPAAVVVRDGRLRVMSAVSPGIRQVQITYTMPAKTVKIPIGDTLSVLEVLTEDSTMTVRGAGLAVQAPVTVQSRTFRRYLAQATPAGAIIEVSSANAGGVTKRGVLIAALVTLVGLAMLFGFTRLSLNPGRVVVSVHDTPRVAEDIARAIAALDARFEGRNPSPSERVEYENKRRVLKDELTAVLAERDDQL